MEKIHVKPISLNEAYSGRRFTTDKLRRFKNSVTFQLPKKSIEWDKLEITIHFGFSSKGSDLDNHVKCFLDCLQKRYNFNDNQVYKLNLSKEIVKKGSEFISYEINDLNKNLKN